jgi:hypothetical protein
MKTYVDSVREKGAEEDYWAKERQGNGSGGDSITRSFLIYTPHQLLFG